MKIAFVFMHMRISPGDGIVSQALTWKNLMEKRGHTVDLIDVWIYYDFRLYDIVQVFSYSLNSIQDIKRIYMKNANIVFAPILDPRHSCIYEKLFSYYGISKPLLVSGGFVLRKIKPFFKGILVRSEFECNWLTKVYGYERDKIYKVMLSSGISQKEELIERENFCLHISRIGDPGKNVKRLIEASEKYQFKLVICGQLRSDESKRQFEKAIRGKHYVEYKGYVSEDEKIDLCKRAKVFALPSIVEGVGLSALEAAVMGCDIVITNLGGPKEYYSNLAKVVNPYDVNDIGMGVRYFLDGNTFQPELSNYIINNFSDNNVAEKIENTYKRILEIP